VELEPAGMRPIVTAAVDGGAPVTAAAAAFATADPPHDLATATDSASTASAPAPAADKPDSTQFHLRKYRPHLSPDLSSVGGVASYEAGFGGQSQVQFSDLLGDHNVAVGLGIYGSLRDSDLYLSYLNRKHRTAWSVTGFQFRKRYGVVGSTRQLDLERQTYRGMQISAMHPFNRFSRLEASVQYAGVAGRFFLGQTAAEAAADPRIHSVRSFVGPGIAYVFDSSVWGMTGPIKGRRMRLSVD